MDRLRRIAAWGAAVIGLLVLGALIAEFAPLGPLGERTEQGAAATEPVAAPTVPDPVVPETTVPVEATTAPTAAPSTTATPTTTATTAVPPIEPVGDPIPVEELELGETQIGELEVGDPADVVLGRLAASLGPPAADTGFFTSAGDFGTCPGEEVRIVRFGMLVVVAVRNDLGEELFTSYRLDEIFADDLAAGPFLATISGLRVGDTVADLQARYSSLDIQFFDGTDAVFFELRSADDGRLLLYGPVTASGPEGLVRGIYSPDQCG